MYKVIIFCLAFFLSCNVFALPTAFDTPAEASKALGQALEKRDLQELRRIFNVPKGENLLSGDNVADRRALVEFYDYFLERNAWEEPEANLAVLYVGEKEWPFPIPLVKDSNGWSFDFQSGKEEMLNRRIGRNELQAIALVGDYVKAQEEYFERDRDGDGFKEFAKLMLSSPGYKNGLFWVRGPGERPSPFNARVAQAVAEGYSADQSTPSPYQGYYYKILKQQGAKAPGGAKNYITSGGRMTEGFALLAYPAKWGYSGVMSFLVGPDGVIYEKDLGASTQKVAVALNSYNPDQSWKRASDAP